MYFLDQALEKRLGVTGAVRVYPEIPYWPVRMVGADAWCGRSARMVGTAMSPSMEPFSLSSVSSSTQSITGL